MSLPQFQRRVVKFLTDTACRRTSRLSLLHCRREIEGFQRLLNQSRADPRRFFPSSISLPPYLTTGDFGVPEEPELKTEKEIDQMLPSCRLAAAVLQEVGKEIKTGMTTNNIDDLVYKLCLEAGAYPSPLHYKGFPKSVCTSVNDVACHGIPSSQILLEGDILNIDITVYYKGYHGDTSATFAVGQTDQRSKALINAARDCRDAAIQVCRDGALFSDIGDIIYSVACEAGLEVIPCFCGHGIGTYFHGPPDIVHVPCDSVGSERMKTGMVFTIEPILCDGCPEITILDDGWTVITTDGSRSAQFEHTIVVREGHSQILTSLEQPYNICI